MHTPELVTELTSIDGFWTFNAMAQSFADGIPPLPHSVDIEISFQFSYIQHYLDHKLLCRMTLYVFGNVAVSGAVDKVNVLCCQIVDPLHPGRCFPAEPIKTLNKHSAHTIRQ